MDISILSKNEFDQLMLEKGINDANVENINDHVIISVNNTLESGDVSYFTSDHGNVKRLFFDDVIRNIESPFGTAKAMTQDQARELLQFINQFTHEYRFIIHCAAGISRSGAIGVYINNYFGGDYGDLLNRHPHIQPNPHVLNLLYQQEKYLTL